MIYTINLISKNKDGTTITTDITNYVENGFSFVKKLDESFDVGSITLLNVEKSTPYNMWDTIQVLVGETETMSLRIAGDTIELFSKRPKTYKHTISLVEHTKLLELFVISGKTFTQPRDPSDAKYSIADVLEILFETTPLEILTLVREAFETGSTISIEESFDQFVYPYQSFSISSTINQSDNIINFVYPYSSESEEMSITTNDTITNFVYAFESFSENLLISTNDTIVNQPNAFDSFASSLTITNNDLITIQPNQASSFSETPNISISDSIQNLFYKDVVASFSVTPNVSLRDSWYHNRPVEWVEGGTQVTANRTCDEESDVGNVKSITDCVFEASPSRVSDTNETSTQPSCSEGATYTLCERDLLDPSQWICVDYTGNVITTYYTCQLQT